MKKFSRILFLFFFTILATAAIAVPTNDDCSAAISLGTLPTPAACTGTGIQVGAAVTATGTTVGATPEAIYPYLSNCSINTASPPNDVWYSFVATSYQAVISITGSTMTNPVITVWSGTCGSLTGRGCVTGAAGAATLTVYQTTPGQTYFIQIAGSTSAQNGTFNLSVHNDQDCARCLTASNITASPPPVNGAYAPGTRVTFCLNITQYTQILQNWLHGVQPTFGAGWDMSTFTPGTPPASVDHAGSWAYYPSGVVSTATGTHWPAGFYYNSTNPHGLAGGPGNSYGDNCPSGNCNWTFCFSITTNSVCSPGSDLSVNISTSADGESGTWTSPGCASDPIASISAIGACCPPLVSSSPDTCGNGLGSATASAIGANGPWTYRWSAGTPAVQTVNGPSTVHGLTAGTVSVTVTDRYNCTSTASITIVQTSFAGPNQGASCVTSLPGGSVTMGALSTGTWSIMAGNPGTCTIANITDPHTTISNFSAAGTYSFLFSRAGGCIDTAQVTVTVKPNAGGDRVVGCILNFPGGAAAMGATTIAGASWTPMPGNPGTATITTPTSPTTTITNFSAPGVYGWVWTNPSGCIDTATTTVTQKPNAGNDQTQNCVILPGAPATLSATAVAGGVWSALASNPAVATISSTTSTTPTISNLTAGGVYNFVWTAPNGCKDTAAVNINPLPVAPPVSTSASTICNGTSTNLTATSAGNNILWYSTATGGSPLTTVPSGTPYTVSPSTTTTYYAEAQSIGGTFTRTFTYTGAAQSWTVPAGVSSATIYLWGGGGGGGGVNASSSNSAGGGGGAVAVATITSPSAGNVYTINIGAGGTAGTTAPSAGGSGGTTTVAGAAGTWTASGGAGGSASTGGGTNIGGLGASTGSGPGVTVIAGGNGGNGTDGFSANPSGGGGAGAGSTGAGANGSSSCGAAAAGGSGTYPGGNGGTTTNCGNSGANGNGNAGTAPGGGGSGAHEINTGRGGSAGSGGAGAPGQVVIVYTLATCTSLSRTAVTITVTPIPAAVTVSGGGSSCNTATLTASGGAGGTIYWQNTTSNGTSTATPSASQTVSASGTYYFNSYNSGCWGAQGSATVSIIPSLAAPVVSATPATICVGSSANLVATSAGNNINWYTSASGGTLLTTTASGAAYTVSPASTTTYYAEAQAPGTGTFTQTFSYTGAVQTWTVPAGATSATVYLWGGGGGGGAARFSANVAGGGGGGGAAAYTTISGLTAGDVYSINIGAGGAGGSGSAGAAAGSGGPTSFSGTLGTWAVNGGAGGTDNNGGTSGTGGAGATTGSGAGLTINAGGSGSNGNGGSNIMGQGGGAGGSSSAGANGPATCTGIAAAGGSGTYPGANGAYNTNCGSTTSSAGVAAAAPGGGGSGAYRGGSSSQNGGAGGNGQVIIVYTILSCPSVRTPVSVTVNPVPTAVTVSGAGTFCNSATLTASGGTGGTIYWQNTTNGGTSTASPSSSQTVTTSGTYYFNSYNSGCWGPQGSATVVINAGPAAPVASATPATICAGSTVALVATAAGDTIKWYSAATGGSPLTSLLSGATYTVTPAATTTYYAEAVPPNTVTNRSDTFFNSGTWVVPSGVSGATIYMWGGGGGGGGVNGSKNNAGGGGGGAFGTATITGLVAGGSYSVTVGAGGSAGTNAPTNGGNGGNSSFSGGAGTWTINGGLGGNGGSNGTGGAGGATGTGTGLTFKTGGNGGNGINGNTGTSGSGGGAGGSGSAGSAGTGCTPGSGGTGTYPGGNGATTPNCGTAADGAGQSGAVPGGGGSGGHEKSGGNAQAGGAGGAGMVIIVYNIVSTPCPSPRTAVTVTVNNVPTAVTVSSSSSCGSSILTATGGTGGTIYWENTTNGGISTATPSSSQTVSALGTYYFRANNTCGWGTQGSATVTINTKPNAGVDTVACQGGVARMHAVVVASGTWSAMAGNPGTASITSSSNAATTITGFSTTGNYNFIWTNSTTGCSDTAAVLVNALPGATIADNAPLCLGGNLTATATPSVPGTYTYQWSGPASYTATGASFSITSAAIANSGTYTLTVTNTATACSATITAAMSVISCLTASGAIFDDANGNGLVDGAETATSHGQTLYAVLADTTGTVVSVGPVAANGSFTVTNLMPNTAGYSISVRSNSPAIGTLAGAYSWPAGWVGTKAQFGTNNLEGSGIYPGPSERVHMAIANTNITNLLIGYDQLPLATPQTYTIPYPHINTTMAITPANSLGILGGSDPEDGSFTTGSTFTITGLAGMNGNTLYYDANGDGIIQPYEQITGLTTITNFDPNKLIINFIGSGSIQAAFNYSTTDAAAQVAATPAVYTIKWIGTLPVKMLYFNAEKQGENQASLKWATASELDNDHFEIERSLDAQIWSNIGEVKGNGTTPDQHDYSFIDAQLLSWVNYYRLKQVDIDGHYTYSNIAEVQFDNVVVSPVDLVMYPNPMAANGILNIQLSNSTDNIKNVIITNAMGQTIYNEANIPDPSYKLTGLDLPSGVYQVSIFTANNNSLTQKLVIQ